MFSESARFYDRIYRDIRDYAADAGRLAAILAREHPGARTILDVACGTGEHARILRREHGYAVDGIDLDPVFVTLAREKNPAGDFREADMVAFDLGRTYDVVTCLFSSIAYARTAAGVTRALARCRAHLKPDGLVVVEPWLPPEEIKAGRVFLDTVRDDDLSIARMSRTEVRDGVSVIRFEYLVGTGEGIEHLTEDHELGLFSVEEMKGCFTAAGLAATYDAGGFRDRGLYLARHA